MKKQTKRDPLVEKIRDWGFIIGLTILVVVYAVVLINALVKIS